MLLGTYEKHWRAVEPKGNTVGLRANPLLPDNMERMADNLEVGFRHFPALQRGRHQEDHQWALHVCPGWQSARRADAASATTG